MKSLLLLMIFTASICLVGCQPDFEAMGQTIVKQYIDVPQSAQVFNAYYYGEGQFRGVWVKFNLPETYVDSFLSTTCFNSLKELSTQQFSFTMNQLPGFTPNWWAPIESNLSVEGSCTDQEKGIGLSIQLNLAKITSVYMYIAI